MQQIQLARRPKGMPVSEDFRFVDVPVPEIDNGKVLVKTLYMSVDPYMRGRMVDAKSYIEPFQLDEVISGGIVGEVVESKSEKFRQGDIVTGMLGWQEYSAAHDREVRKVDPNLAPVTTALGILGLTGLTAYFGMLDIGKPKEGETVVVSGAAGAVGSVAGQIARIKGARVVGIAGTDEKTGYLLTELGFDAAINYKTTEYLHEALRDACPDGVDVYFDNVGGVISDAVMDMLNKHARIPVCGAISSYNAIGENLGPRVQSKLIKSSALMKGFIVGDYSNQFLDGALQLADWLKSGKLKYEETVIDGFENIPQAFIGLFEGKNLGKQLVKVADPEYTKL